MENNSHQNENDGFKVIVNSPGNFIAKDMTFTGPINIGADNNLSKQGGYNDVQIATALANIVGRGKAIDAKKKWAGAIWLLQWVANFPSNTKKACERINQLPLPEQLDYKCDYRNVRELATLSFLSEDARNLDQVRYSKNDEGAFLEMRQVVVALDEELKKTTRIPAQLEL